MLIKKRSVVIADILTVNDFEKFIIDLNLYKFFIKFNPIDKPKIEDLISKTPTIGIKKVKPILKSILNYPNSIYNKDFLLSMGWELNDIEKFISDKQKKNSQVLVNEKRNNPEKFKNSYTNRIEYWLNKGYSDVDASQKLKDRQSTFSLSKCIEKYGEDIGKEMFNKRQQKWITTLKSKETYGEIQKTKNIFKYGIKDKETLFKFANYSEKTMDVITKCSGKSDIKDFVDCIIVNDDIKRYSDLLPYINSSVIHNVFNISHSEIKDIFYRKIDLNQNRQYYGIVVYHNGIRYKSVGEYRIALYLESKNINFIYEKTYPNSNLKSDFYLVDNDLYIEYYGLLNKKNLDKLDATLSKYYEKVKIKNKFCMDNELNLIYDFDYKELITKIKNYYEN
jgi:hypothetical protein